MPRRKAEEIMTRKLLTFRPDTDVYQAMTSLVNRRFSGASVVDEEGRLVGVLSEKDLLRVLKGEVFDGLPEGRVGDFMSSRPITVEPSTSLFDVVGLFLDKPIRRLPVVEEGGKLVGQISRRDVLRAIEAMRKDYLYPAEENQLDTESEGLQGVSSAMRHAKKL